MNPNPFASLNHFTVPVTIPTLLSMFGRHLAALSAPTCGYANVTFDVVDLIPKAPPALPPAIQAGAIPPKVTGFAVQTPAVVPGDGIPWWDKDGLRSERAGKRHPAPSDVAPRSSRVRRPGAGSARVRALAARCRAALVADAAGRAARVRQLAVQRALLVRGEPAAHQPRAPGRGRSSLPRRALGRAALSPRTRGLRGDALLPHAAFAQCLRRARQADRRSYALRSLRRPDRTPAQALRALRRRHGSAPGQRWRSPLYRGEALGRTASHWWLHRFAQTFARFEAVRLDHFIGFTRYWEAPAREPTAKNGRWRPGPRAGLFEALGPAQLIAEDLGEVTPEVTALRERFGVPGVRGLQFAFGTDVQARAVMPHNYERNSVAYTGTHDNDTTSAWFHDCGSPQRSEEQCEEERRMALAYLGVKDGGREIHWDIIRGVWGSVANLAIAPVQDLLGLGSEARMTLPGTAEGNWEWRLEALPDVAVLDRLGEMTGLYGRSAR